MREDGKPGFIEKMLVSCGTGALIGGLSGAANAPKEAREHLTDMAIDLALKGDEYLHDRRERKQWDWITDILNNRK